MIATTLAIYLPVAVWNYMVLVHQRGIPKGYTIDELRQQRFETLTL